MLAPTHLVFGQTAYLSLCVATGHVPTYAEALVAVGCSLLPDLDNRQSIVGRLLFPLAGWLEYQFGHRTFTHALAFQIIVGLVLYHTVSFGWFLAVMSGWVSHSFADMMTPSGVCWLWPSQVHCVLPGNEDYRIEIMSYGELSFAVIIAVLAFPLLMWAQTGEGTTGLIRAALGNIASARQEYDAEKGTWAWTLKVQGKDNQTHANISGTYPVRGHWNENGFLIDTEEGSVTICRSSTCNWYADHVVLVRGDPEQTTTQEITVKNTTGAHLAEDIRLLETAGKVFILGTLNIPPIPKMVRVTHQQPVTPTVTTLGETVTLNYASIVDLATIGTVLSAQLAVQVRHPPGIQVPKLQQAPVQQPTIDPLLEKWLQ